MRSITSVTKLLREDGVENEMMLKKEENRKDIIIVALSVLQLLVSLLSNIELHILHFKKKKNELHVLQKQVCHFIVITLRK